MQGLERVESLFEPSRRPSVLLSSQSWQRKKDIAHVPGEIPTPGSPGQGMLDPSVQPRLRS